MALVSPPRVDDPSRDRQLKIDRRLNRHPSDRSSRTWPSHHPASVLARSRRRRSGPRGCRARCESGRSFPAVSRAALAARHVNACPSHDRLQTPSCRWADSGAMVAMGHWSKGTMPARSVAARARLHVGLSSAAIEPTSRWCAVFRGAGRTVVHRRADGRHRIHIAPGLPIGCPVPGPRRGDSCLTLCGLGVPEGAGLASPIRRLPPPLAAPIAENRVASTLAGPAINVTAGAATDTAMRS